MPSIADTTLEMIQWVFPEHAGAPGQIHGGRMMQWITQAGTMAAARIARGTVVLGAMDDLDFLHPVKVGEAFWEPGFDVVHYQAANLRTDIASKFVVFMLCAPDVPMMTFLDEEEIAAREHLRYQSSERHT